MLATTTVRSCVLVVVLKRAHFVHQYCCCARDRKSSSANVGRVGRDSSSTRVCLALCLLRKNAGVYLRCRVVRCLAGHCVLLSHTVFVLAVGMARHLQGSNSFEGRICLF